MSCPDPIPLSHAKLLRYKNYKATVAGFFAGNMKWDDKALSPLKLEIRLALRANQAQSCYYCRRLIVLERRNMSEAIEHYLDKSQDHYRRWTFHPLNLVVACQPCNFEKSTTDLGDASVRSATYLQPNIGQFRWLHPYFDSYLENIKVSPGPVFSAIPNSPREAQAVAMIRELKLDSIANMDDRVQFLADELKKLMARSFKAARRGTRYGKRDRYEAFQNELESRIEKGMLQLHGV